MSVTKPSATPSPRVAAAPAIVAEGLAKSYQGTPALQSLDLEVATGTVVGLLGPNGAGKTTLIRVLSTVLRPDAGRFSIAGIPHVRADDIRRRIGVLPESAGYPGAQTCTEWLTYHARLFGARPRAARETAVRLLDEVGLGDRAESLVSGLSRGMRQRLGIARALVNGPSLVFLDEPTLGLDPLGQRQVLALVTRVSREHGASVVLSTHLLDEVEQVCDRVLILHRGRLVADGSTADVVRRAAAPRRGRAVVPDHLRDRAVARLGRHGFRAALVTAGHRSEVEVELPGSAPVAESAAEALRTLLEAGVPVLGFALEGGRLSDAFLSVTAGDPDD